MADLTKWKLVPVEPTEEMDSAARDECHRMAGCIDPVLHVWDVMLSASPAPSLPTREEIARVIYEATCVAYNARPGWAGEPGVVKTLHHLQADAILALFAQPQEKKQGSVEPPPSP